MKYLIFGLLFTVGCADTTRTPEPLQKQIGKNCIVYFRKDALGMGADVPSSVLTGAYNGAEVNQAGELLEVSSQWIVIGYHGRVFYIPREVIQIVEFGTNINQSPGLSLPQPVHTDDHSHAGHEHH